MQIVMVVPSILKIPILFFYFFIFILVKSRIAALRGTYNVTKIRKNINI